MITISPTKLRDLFSYHKPVASYLNLWAFDEDILVGVDLQMSVVFELTGINMSYLDEQGFVYTSGRINKLIDSLPEGITVSFLNQTRLGNNSLINEYKNTINQPDDLSCFVIENKVKAFSKNTTYREKIYLYVTSYPDEKEILKPSIFKVINPQIKIFEANKKRVQDLNNVSSVIVSTLKDIGLTVRQLKRDEISVFLYEHLNPGRSEQQPLDLSGISNKLTLRSQVVFNAVENDFSQVFIDGYYYRALNLYIRPSNISAFNLIQLLNKIPGEYDFSFTFNTADQGKLENKLQFQATVAAVISGINPFKKYHEAEIKSNDTYSLIRDTKESFHKLFLISGCVILRDTNLEALTKRANNLVSDFRILGDAEAIIDDMNHLFLFLSVLPNHSQFNLRRHIFNTEAVSQLFCVHQPWKGTENPKMLFLTNNNQLLPLDLFDKNLPAKHGLVLGSTGSGKSFTTNYLLTNFHIESTNNHTVICDIGGSYRKLCGIFPDSQYLEVDLSEKYAINPFPEKKYAYVSGEFDTDIMNYLKLLIQKLLKRDGFSGEESMLIIRAIEKMYSQSTNDPPLLGDLVDILADFNADSETKKLALQFSKNLEYWSKGLYAKMLNRKGNLSINSRLVVFDLQKLQEHPELIPIIFFVIQNVIWNKLYDKTLQKVIVFDECWSYFNDKVSAELIENLYRTARKYNAMILSISQSPEDFLSSSVSRAVLSNSYTKFILMLKKDHGLLKDFGLSEEEIEEVKLLTSKRKVYSDIFVKFDKNSRVIRIQPNKCDYWICTTDPEDYNKEMAVKKQNKGINSKDLLLKLIEQGE